MNTPHTQKRSSELLVRLVDAIEATGNVTEACRRVGVTPSIAYKWRKASLANPEDPRFLIEDPLGEEPAEPLHQLWDERIEISMDAVEAKMRLLATGYEEPVIYEGRQMYKVDPLGELTVNRDPISGDVSITPAYERDPITGELVPLTVTKYVVRAGELLLKAHRAHKFRDNVSVDVSSSKGGVLCVPMVMSQEEYDKAFSGPGKSPDWSKEQMTPPKKVAAP